jgi:hypothetical protein
MNCCGRKPTAEIRRAIWRRRAWRWTCSALPPGSAREETGDDPYRALLQLWLRVRDGFDGSHPSCTVRWCDKRRVLTH